MKRLYQKKFRGRVNMFALVGLCLALYFSYHLIFGERSLLSLAALKNKRAAIELEYAAAQSERSMLEDKVKRLRPASVDADLLEERMAYMLGFYAKDSTVVITPRKN